MERAKKPPLETPPSEAGAGQAAAEFPPAARATVSVLDCLAEFAREMYEAEKRIDLAKERKVLLSVAKALVGAAKKLGQVDPDVGSPAYSAHKQRLEAQAVELSAMVSKMPDPRMRVMPKGVAEAFVLLIDRRPALTNDGADVNRLRSILSEAGLHLSPERVRNLLSSAAKAVGDGTVSPSGRMYRDEAIVSAQLEALALAAGRQVDK